MNVLTRTDLRTAAQEFEQACAASREHSRRASVALREFGNHGAQISGCVRDHFPDETKSVLRALAQAIARHSDAGHTARPSRVRTSTMRQLAREIATRDGSGFYGPQPIRA